MYTVASRVVVYNAGWMRLEPAHTDIIYTMSKNIGIYWYFSVQT